MIATHPEILTNGWFSRFMCGLVLAASALVVVPRIASAEEAAEFPTFSELRTDAGILILDIPSEYIEADGDNGSCADTSGGCAPVSTRFVSLTATQPRSSLRVGCVPQGDGLRGVYCRIESTF